MQVDGGDSMIVLTSDDLKDLNDKLTKWYVFPPSECKKMINTLKAAKLTKKNLKASKLHLTINSIVKSNPKNKSFQEIVGLMKEIRESWKKELMKPDDAEDSKNLKQTFTKNEAKITPNSKILPELSDPTRNKALKMIFQIFSAEDLKEKIINVDAEFDFSEKTIAEFSIGLEEEMYSLNSSDYSSYARERVLILKSKQNDDLKIALLTKDLSFNEFATKDSIDLVSDETKKRLEEGHLWSMKAYVIKLILSLQSDFYMKNVEIKDGEFKCRKCKSAKIYTTQKQMRSADEPMTTFFFCTSCRHTWKMN